MARVLVVEDQAENLDLMVYLLRAFGHETLVARNGAEGVAAVTRDRPDLVVMDLQMPVMDGYEAAAQLKGDPRLSSLPVVAVTAYAMVGDRERITAAGFDGYLTKPLDPQSFVRDLERYLAPSPAGRARHRSGRDDTVARILVVDDQADNRDLLCYLLGYYGHEVITAVDGRDAVRAALAEHPDLIIMDIVMPGMDGYAAARLMRSEPALTGVPLVAVSATGAVTLRLSQACGFDAFYPMPIEPQEFVTLLEAWLRRQGVAMGATRGEP